MSGPVASVRPTPIRSRCPGASSRRGGPHAGRSAAASRSSSSASSSPRSSIALQLHDRSLRDRGEPAVASVVVRGGERRLEFTTAEGRAGHRAREPLRTGTGDAPVGSDVEIRYDPAHPRDVITDESKLARDITLWIVAAKLVVAGAIVVAFGLHRLREDAAARDEGPRTGRSRGSRSERRPSGPDR